MDAKSIVGQRAAELVQDGMLVGLGTGTTAACFIDALGRRVADGLKIRAVATSVASTEQARRLGIEVLEQVEATIDLTVDGADEIDPELQLIKGLGGALVREKIVAAASDRMVVVSTDDKLVDRLGRGPLPVEIVPFLPEATAARLRQLGLEPRLRESDESPYVSDNGNWIFDCALPAGTALPELAAGMEAVPGVVGHGLFLGLASMVLVAGEDQKVRELHPPT